MGWADVATKHDLAGLEDRTALRFDSVNESIKAASSDLRATFEHELRAQSTSFEHELRTQTTTVMFSLVGVVLTMAALAFALARFT